MPDAVVRQLADFLHHHAVQSCLLAFSGGMDSHVLLHACAGLRKHYAGLRLRALHVDHGLQAGSVAWARHCEAVCKGVDVSYTAVPVNLAAHRKPGESLEALAREARYRVMAEHLDTGEMLLTAHHQDDQAETLLLHLLRGSGTDGLAAMPAVRPFASGYLGRPFLDLPRDELVRYACQHGLVYISDPSNEDVRHDRNFLRHTVLPILSSRWPAAPRTLARAARLQGESRQLLALCIRSKRDAVQGSRPGTLSVKRLLGLESVWQKALLRDWLAGQGSSFPTEKQLLQVIHTVLQARSDAMPWVRWQGGGVRRYRDDLYSVADLPAHDPHQVLAWQDTSRPLFVPSWGQSLPPEMVNGWQQQLPGALVCVRFRRGGETVHIPGRGNRRYSLKHLFQEAGIPPWERNRLPLVYVREILVAVPGVVEIPP